MLSPTPHHNPRDDILEVSILDTINIPNRKDGSPRQPFFSALIPATEQRWQQQQTSSSPSPQTFFFSVADRQEHAVKIALWDRKEDGTTDEHQKLLGECTLPLFYIGWQWVDAKLKLKAADGAQPSKYAASYLRTRMRFTRDSRSGGRSGEIPTIEDWEPRKEEVGTPKSPADRKKFWRHTRDLGKRSPVIDRKHNEFLMSQDIRAVGGPEYAENMDKTSVRQEMILSQPVRTISINASDSSSDESDSDSPPPAKQGSGIGRRLSRDFTKLRQLLTSTDTSHTTQQPLSQARSLSPKGSSAGGKKFWTTGRQSQVSLEVSKSVDVIPSVQSIDWSNGEAQARTFSDGDMASLSQVKTKTKSEKKKEKKKDKEEREKAAKENGDALKRVKAAKKKHGKDKSSTGSFAKSKLGKKLGKKKKKEEGAEEQQERHDDHVDANNDKEEEGWERDSSGDGDGDGDSDSEHKKKRKHRHKRDKVRGAEGLESGVTVVVTAADEAAESDKSDKSCEFEAVTVSSSSGEASPPVEERQLKLAKKKKDKRKSKSGSLTSATLASTAAEDKPAAAADKKTTKSPTKPKKSP